MDKVDWKKLGAKLYKSRNLLSTIGAAKITVMAFSDSEDWMVMRLYENWVMISARKFHQRYKLANTVSVRN